MPSPESWQLDIWLRTCSEYGMLARSFPKPAALSAQLPSAHAISTAATEAAATEADVDGGGGLRWLLAAHVMFSTPSCDQKPPRHRPWLGDLKGRQ